MDRSLEQPAQGASQIVSAAPEAASRSRRSVLGAAIAIGVGAAAAGFGKTGVALADGENIISGLPNDFNQPTDFHGAGTLGPDGRGGRAIGVFLTTNGNASTAAILAEHPSTNGNGIISRGGTGRLNLSGTAVGIRAESLPTGGTGVFGHARSTSGPNMGVVGRTESPSGIGTAGRAASTVAGSSIGVFGRTDGPAGTGVSGRSMAATGAGVGVYGDTGSPDGVGVHGKGGKTGVFGEAPSPGGVGVHGASSGVGTIGVRGTTSGGTAVSGTATSSTSIAVRGTTVSGTAGKFTSIASGRAIDVVGRAVFSTAGKATIPTGASQVTVDPGILILTTSVVLCTAQINPGPGVNLRFVTLDTGSDTFTINLNKPCTVDTPVAWFMVG